MALPDPLTLNGLKITKVNIEDLKLTPTTKYQVFHRFEGVVGGSDIKIEITNAQQANGDAYAGGDVFNITFDKI